MRYLLLFCVLAAGSLVAGEVTVEPPSDLKRLANSGDIEGIRALLEKGVDVNDRSGGFGGNALIWARDYRVTEFLLENGGDPGIRTAIQNMTPLMWAAQNGDIKQVKLLIAAGLKINDKDDLGGDALFYSIGNLSPDVTAYLLENGAHVDTQDYQGTTPLMRAMFNAEVDQVRVLLHHGANTRLVNFEKNTAMDLLQEVDLSAEKEDIETVKSLLREAQQISDGNAEKPPGVERDP